MSRVYFHAQHRTAEVGGSERSYFGSMADKFAHSLLAVMSEDIEWIREITVDPPDYLAKALAAPKPDAGALMDTRYLEWSRWTTSWRIWASVAGVVRVGENTIPFTDLALNTLVAMNSPQLSFAAHVYGCCENHGWIAEEHAGWLAELIECGREENVFRAGQGWEDVIELARDVEAGSPGPIVMSYSVCEGFPNPSVADWGGDWDRWSQLGPAEQWERGVRGLIASDWPFAMGPDRQAQGFCSGHSAFDLRATRWTGQLA